MYYLHSRYYDPKLSRFINADDANYARITNNLFYYCKNIPSMCKDPNGFVYFYYGYKPPVYPTYDVQYSYNPDSLNFIEKNTAKIMWNTSGEFATSLENSYPDGVNFYMHYRGNSGKLYEYNYNDVISEDNSAFNSFMLFLSSIKSYAIRYSQKYNVTKFIMSSDFESVNCSTLNWKLAINKHYVMANADVSCTSTKSKDLYTVQYYIIAWDKYDFNAGGDFYGIPNDWNGQFVTLGWAKDFFSIGRYSNSLTWSVQK